ncbi:hypothetical protein ACYZTX_29140 [Pseudomonas sp. MDT1-17]
MSLIVQPDVVAQHLEDICKDINTERVTFQGLDIYRCGMVDGRLATLLSLELISLETYEELMALGEECQAMVAEG